MKGLILERNLVNVSNVVKLSVVSGSFKYMKGNTVQKNLRNVQNVVKPSVIQVIYVNREVTVGRNPVNVKKSGKTLDSFTKF